MSNIFPSIQFPSSIGVSSLPSVQISSLPNVQLVGKTFKGVSFVSNGSSYSGSVTGRVVLVLIGGGGGGGGGGSGAGGGAGGNGAVVAVVLPYGSYSLSCSSGTGGSGGTGNSASSGSNGSNGGNSNCTITETTSNIQFGNITASGGGGGQGGGSSSAGSGGPGGTPSGYVMYAEASIAVNGSNGGSPQSTAQTISSQTQPGLVIIIPSVNGANNTAYGGGGPGSSSGNGYSGGPGAVFVGVLQ